jgi:hypothetical protein
MTNTKIEINFQIDDEFIPYGENKPIKSLEEYQVLINEYVETFMSGLYPFHTNLSVGVTTSSL